MANNRRNQESDVARYVPWVILFIVLIVVYSMYNGSSPDSGESGESSQSVEATATTGTAADKKPATPQGKEVEITAQVLNLRSTPAKSPGNVISTLTKGTVLKLEEQNDGWLKVSTAQGRVGYVAFDEKFLRIR